MMDGTADSQKLERLRNWVSALPAEDARAIQHTSEFQDFLQAFTRLEEAHRNMVLPSSAAAAAAAAVGGDEDALMEDIGTPPRASPPRGGRSVTTASFLQQVAADEVILRIMNFLECQSLVRTTMTCSRLYNLAKRNAHRRTRETARERQLTSDMQLLRAKEQIDGSTVDDRTHSSPHVRVPTLLLSRRIHITGCGDPELNGIYYCTGCNGNGFVFTKPRHPEIRVERTTSSTGTARMVFPDESYLDDSRQGGGSSGEVSARPGQLLRCIIAKRFSHATILWYLSREVLATDEDARLANTAAAAAAAAADNAGDGDNEQQQQQQQQQQQPRVRAGDITQVFCFWSKLMVSGEASPDICRYPSQTSVLARQGEGWNSLPTLQNVASPIVELLD